MHFSPYTACLFYNEINKIDISIYIRQFKLPINNNKLIIIIIDLTDCGDIHALRGPSPGNGQILQPGVGKHG